MTGAKAEQNVVKDKSDDKVVEPTKQTKQQWEPLTDGVKWIEKYSENLENFFERLPEFITTFIATLAVFTFGATLRGMDRRY